MENLFANSYFRYFRLFLIMLAFIYCINMVSPTLLPNYSVELFGEKFSLISIISGLALGSVVAPFIRGIYSLSTLVAFLYLFLTYGSVLRSDYVAPEGSKSWVEKINQ